MAQHYWQEGGANLEVDVGHCQAASGEESIGMIFQSRYSLLYLEIDSDEMFST